MDWSSVAPIEASIRNSYIPLSVAHGFDHLRRTAVGSSWFARIFGCNRESQVTAYLAGLIHDLKRPPTEKIDHTQISLSEAEKLLNRSGLSAPDTAAVLDLIGQHRDFSRSDKDVQWVFLADKLLEQAGAFLPFRRFYYIGECEDLTDLPFEEAADKYWGYRMAKFSPDKFPPRVRRLADYQFGRLYQTADRFRAKDPAVTELGRIFHTFGSQKRRGLAPLISAYKPDDDFTAGLKTEALAYLTGKKYADFERLIDL